MKLSLTIAAVLLLAHVGYSNGASWTAWYNRDGPDGTGDFESLKELRDEYPDQICPKPLDIESVTVRNMIPADKTGQTFYAYDTSRGFICRNKDQKSGVCKDYQVRFKCPCPE
ncbi:hypothetical protein ATANTOWER_027370 [Ataeniobius toweri]|uniref:WxxW domain-containing protein n=1 Tax=Ataeniobius toweri TaxID=208326 RepID=A0ABU7ARB9_9TELE|nr:hypothetical protein [Ataeniobius toweri]